MPHRLVVFLALLCVSPAASAADAPIKAFFGNWQGSGISTTSESLYFAETVRDFDVTIKPAGQGFTVAWTTVLRQGGDPNNPDVRRNAAEKTFVPSANGRFYVANSLPDPMSGQDYAWARVQDRTLTVNIMTIQDDGNYTIQVYERTLKAPGMDLKFTKVRGGEPTRSVEGRLVKIGN